jgi:hypothetical protein
VTKQNPLNNNWKVFAAAAGASLSMATGAEASVIHTTVNLTASINPAANINTFALGAALEAVDLGNQRATSFMTGGGGPHSTQSFFQPRRGTAAIAAGIYDGNM